MFRFKLYIADNFEMVSMNRYLTDVINYFIFRGKKATIERLMYNYLLTKAKKKNKTFLALMQKCNLRSTPYVYAKMRGKGKRIKYRIHHLSKKNRYLKSVQNVGLTVGATLRLRTNSFTPTLERELRLWGLGKHPLRKKRLEVHRIARKNAPYRWFVPKVKKIFHAKKTKNKTIKNLIFKIAKKIPSKTIPIVSKKRYTGRYLGK